MILLQKESCCMDTIKPIPSSYMKPCSHAGRLEELQIPDFSPALVYLPYGYDDLSAPLNTFYFLHGGGGNHRSFFSEDGLAKNLFDHMIQACEIDPMLIIAPSYYPLGYSGKGISYSAEAVKDFGPVLMNRIVPLVDRTYRTVPDRIHRAIGGFSMGAVATWYTLMAGLDLFHWFMPLSGDCWICGELGGGLHAKQTAALLGDSLLGREFYIHALIGDEDIAFPNLDPQMQAMKEFPETFSFGRNTFYSVLKGGVHDYPDVRCYIYNALPEFFR